MAIVNNQGYLTRKGSNRVWWMIRTLCPKKHLNYGVVDGIRIIRFPKEMIGKKVAFKVIIIED